MSVDTTTCLSTSRCLSVSIFESFSDYSNFWTMAVVACSKKCNQIIHRNSTNLFISASSDVDCFRKLSKTHSASKNLRYFLLFSEICQLLKSLSSFSKSLILHIPELLKMMPPVRKLLHVNSKLWNIPKVLLCSKINCFLESRLLYREYFLGFMLLVDKANFVFTWVIDCFSSIHKPWKV